MGDVFTKGPDPVGVWECIGAHGIESVLGNHDAALLSRPDRITQLGLPEAATRWLSRLPLFRRVGDWTVVHAGLHPEAGSAGTARSTALVVRRWPDDSDLDHPFWWEVYAGPERVLYGHDAVRGLQDHRPRTLGLDTGCVYGGRLTGYLVEDDALVSVPAEAVYRAV